MTQKIESSEKTTDDVQETVANTKEKLAKIYLDFLDQQKGGILGTSAGLGITLNPLQKDAIEYLTTESGKKKGIFSNLEKNIKKKLIEQATGGTLLEYDKIRLGKMKDLITQYKDDKNKLEELMVQIQAGTDPTIIEDSIPQSDKQDESIDQKTQSEEQKNTTNNQTDKPIPSYIETQNNKRKDVLSRLDKIVVYDKDVKDIKYTRGGRTSVRQGLDCSGLIIYTLHQAGLEIPGAGDSRGIFKKLDTKKLDMANDGSFKGLEGYEAGDLLFRNTTNPKYDWKEGKIPTIKKDKKNYRIHHIAFIKKVDHNQGKITIVESNGSQGVIERELTYKEVQEANHKSELYAGKVDYDNLLAYNKTSKDKSENLA